MTQRRGSKAKPTKPPANPSALADAAQAFKELQECYVPAGRAASAEAQQGLTEPSPEVLAMWREAAPAALRVLTMATHLAEGGRYDAEDVATLEDCQMEFGGTPAPSSDSSEQAAGEDAVEPAEEESTEDSEDVTNTEDADEETESKAPPLDKQLADFTRALRKIDDFKDTSDEEAAAAFTLWRQAHPLSEDRYLAFQRFPGLTAAGLLRYLQSRWGSAKTTASIPKDSEVGWHKRVWEITTSKVVCDGNFAAKGSLIQAGMHVTQLDVAAQFLGAAASVPLGHGDPIEITIDPDAKQWPQPVAQVFGLGKGDKKNVENPGYLRLADDVHISADAPKTVRLAFEGKLRKGVYVPTPVARYLVKNHGVEMRLDYALIWPLNTHGRHLGTFAEKLRKGLAKLRVQRARGEFGAAAALAMAKRVYASFLGGMTRSAKKNHTQQALRPDWNDMWKAVAAVNALRALDKALANGYEPLALLRDSAFFAQHEAGPVKPEGMRFVPDEDEWHAADANFQTLAEEHSPGKWAVEAWCEADEAIVQAVNNGRSTMVKRLVEEGHEARLAAA